MREEGKEEKEWIKKTEKKGLDKVEQESSGQGKQDDTYFSVEFKRQFAITHQPPRHANLNERYEAFKNRYQGY